MKVLQVCYKMPFPLHDGGAYSVYHSALGLIYQGVGVKVLAINTPRNWVDNNCIPLEFREKTRFEFARVDTRINLIRAFLNLFSGKSYLVWRFYSDEYNLRLKEILKNEVFDIIQFEHIYMCVYLDTIRQYSKARVILRPQNVENSLWMRILRNKRNPLVKMYLLIATNRLAKFEKKMAGKVDGIIAISEGDARTFLNYVPQKPVINVPTGFDLTGLKSYDPARQYLESSVFYHLGSMDWMPNLQGIEWFIKDILPFVKNRFPGFRFRLAGKRMPEWIGKLGNDALQVDGEVDDSVKYQEDKAVMIVPLISGGGIRIKIIEGMALGKTIISTSVGAEGIPYTHRKNILIANNREEFAEAIGSCMDSKEYCIEIGRNARQLAAENFDCSRTAKKMVDFYIEVIKTN